MPKTAKGSSTRSAAAAHTQPPAMSPRDLPMIGRGSADAMMFRHRVRNRLPFNKLYEFERGLLSKPINDLSDLLRIAEIYRYYMETSDEKLEDFLQFGAPEAAGPRLALAVFELATKMSKLKEAA